MSQSKTGYEGFRRRFTAGLDMAVSSVEISLVLMGPGEESTRPSRRLREELHEWCKGEGVSVFPEHPDLQLEARKRFGKGHTLCQYELQLVQVADLVVIIPDSAGSFAELGMLSAAVHLAPKLLVLADARYRGRASYLSEGPLKEVANGRGEVLYVDYKKPDSVWLEVQARLEQRRSRKALARAMAGGTES